MARGKMLNEKEMNRITLIDPRTSRRCIQSELTNLWEVYRLQMNWKYSDNENRFIQVYRENYSVYSDFV